MSDQLRIMFTLVAVAFALVNLMLWSLRRIVAEQNRRLVVLQQALANIQPPLSLASGDEVRIFRGGEIVWGGVVRDPGNDGRWGL